MSEEKLELIVEDLLIIESKSNFCADIETFNNLMMTNSEVKFNKDKDKILYKDLEVDYKVQLNSMDEANDKGKNAFHTSFICREIDKVETFEKFLRLTREIFHKVCINQYVLKDDISFYYSKKSYPLIHEIENLMRKLINKFMIINVGVSWTDNHIPEEVKLAKGNSITTTNVSYLHGLNFIELSNILFKKYSPLSTDELMQKINEASELNSLSLDDLKEYVPKSNWERFFGERINCEQEFLNKRWKKIYDLRNKVAHNNIFKNRDYQELKTNIEEVNEKLEEAIESLDKINVTEEEKEMVSNNIMLEDQDEKNNLVYSSNKDLMLEFYAHYKVMEWKLIELIEEDIKKRYSIKNSGQINSKLDLIRVSQEERINYIKEHTKILPTKAINEIILLNEVLEFSKELTYPLSEDEVNMLVKCLNRLKKINLYISSKIKNTSKEFDF